MKSIKFLLITLILLGISKLATAQDVIVKKDNSTILSKVVEITNTEIKYKKWSNQDGPTYSISKSDILRINYLNGDVDMFSQNETPQIIQTESQHFSQAILQVANSEREPQPVKQMTERIYSRSRVQFSLNGGVNIPLGKFGETNDDLFCAPFSLGGDEFRTGYGAAKTGYTASMKLHIPIYKDDNDNNIIGLLLKFNFNYNGITDKEKSDYRKRWYSLGEDLNYVYNTNAYYYQINRYSSYRNFSFMIGADFTHYFSKPFALFVEADFGLNLASISNTEIKNLYGNTYLYYENYTNYYSGEKIEIKYKDKVNFVYEIGGGVFLFNHLSVGLFYTGYSPFQVSATMLETNSYYGNIETDMISQKLKISALSVQLGIHF